MVYKIHHHQRVNVSESDCVTYTSRHNNSKSSLQVVVVEEDDEKYRNGI